MFGRRRHAEDALLDELDDLLKILEAILRGFGVEVPDEELDLAFVVGDVGLDVVVVDELGPLGLREDEVGETEKADPGIEWEPADDEDGPGLNEEKEVEDDPVDQPWC